MNRIAKPLIALVALSALMACETVAGAGQDIQKAGNAIEETAEDAES